MPYHHNGNCTTTASAQASFSCSATMSALSSPPAYARADVAPTTSRSSPAAVPKSAASTTGFHFIAYRSDSRTS